VTLRNFGLSFSRQDARPDAGISWRPRRAASIGFVPVLVLLAALWAMLAHAASEDCGRLSRPLASRPLCKRLPDGKLHAWCRNGASEATADRTIFSSLSNRPV
jgi:hypothetical protein